MCCFWVWIAFCLLLHYIKYKKCVKPSSALSEVTTDEREEITNEELDIQYVPDALKSSCISALGETQELTTELADSDNGLDAEAGEGIKAKETSISMVAEA